MGGKRGRLIPPEDRKLAISLICEACAAGARRHKACEILEISLRTLERWEVSNGEIDKRSISIKIPGNKLTQEEREQIIKIANSKEYSDYPPGQIVPRLADNGVYIASESSWYRVMREENMLTHRHATRPKKHSKPKELVATAPNQVWSWDISYLPTQIAGMFYYLYMIVDIFSRKIVGHIVHTSESEKHAAALATQAFLDENVKQSQVVLHSDNGSPMKGATMLATLQRLGIMPSFSRPSVSDDNPYSESLFKTLKYHCTYPRDKFKSLEHAREWIETFVTWYNTVHLHSGIKFVTPEQRHQGKDELILGHRKEVYELAKSRTPERWSGETRNWTPIQEVILNPGKALGEMTNKVI